LDGATAIKASRAIHLSNAIGVKLHTIIAQFNQIGATAFSAATIVLQGSQHNDDADTGMITNPTLAIGSTPERFANAGFYFQVSNTTYTKAINAAGTVFSAAHVIGDGASALWGVVNIYINASGSWLTEVPSTPQIYTTAALALAAANAMPARGGYTRVGQILINSDTTTWTANTDDMTNGSDLTTATFISTLPQFQDMTTYALVAADITAHQCMFHVKDKNPPYVRLFLSALTGSVSVDAWYAPEDSH
jgi:hypothetical protein